MKVFTSIMRAQFFSRTFDIYFKIYFKEYEFYKTAVWQFLASDLLITLI